MSRNEAISADVLETYGGYELPDLSSFRIFTSPFTPTLFIDSPALFAQVPKRHMKINNTI